MATIRNLLAPTGGLMLAALLVVLDASAQCSVFSRGYGGRPWPGSSIGVLAGEGVSEADIVAAIAIWERGCVDLFAVGRIPRLLPNRPGDRTVRVDLDAGVNPTHGVCGTFNAASIRIWRFTLHRNEVISCGPVARLIAHELGHVLGLGDAPELRECSNHIMSRIWLDRLLIDRVQPGECEIVAAANVPGLGLEGRPAELVAASEGAERGLAAAVAAVDADFTHAEEHATLAGEPRSRLVRFVEKRAAMRRGLAAPRNAP
jgi:hypothetical protein